jgi:hypothetical protein
LHNAIGFTSQTPFFAAVSGLRYCLFNSGSRIKSFRFCYNEVDNPTQNTLLSSHIASAPLRTLYSARFIPPKKRVQPLSDGVFERFKAEELNNSSAQ